MTRKGVWNLQQVRDKYLQSLWTNDTRLFAWGNNASGRLGQNNTTQYSSPVQVLGSGGWTSLFTSCQTNRSAASGVKEDGTLWAWGQNYRGQLGQNSTTYQSSPIQIPGSTWSHISMGGPHAIATKTDGTLWSWGDNGNGQLGVNDVTVRSSPVQIGSATDWDKSSKFKFAGGYDRGYAIKTDGTLWTWGFNQNGELGLNNRTHYSSPVQIPGSTWNLISSDVQCTFAIKTDGTLWAWGRNQYYGLLGVNDRTSRSSPTQIPGTDWRNIWSGQYNTIATRTDGTLWTWGLNDRGSLGQNNKTKYSSPVQIPGTDWSNGATGENTAIYRKTDGTLWGAGLNSQGQYGWPDLHPQGGPGWRSSPIQIPGTWGEELSCGDGSFFATKAGPLTPSQL